MKCFGKYIKSLDSKVNKEKVKKTPKPDIKSIDDLEITVHCQINTFKWLVDYLKNPNENCDINLKNIHSILTSSDYLDMPKLSNL
jgi:hypothetical protein